jgi:hypothetical protein
MNRVAGCTGITADFMSANWSNVVAEIQDIAALHASTRWTTFITAKPRSGFKFSGVA